MDKPRIIDILSGMIDSEIAGTEKLLDLLRKEREQINGNPDHLVMLSEEKLVLITELEQLDQKRTAVIADMGYSPDKIGMQAFIEQCGDKSGTLQERWSLLCEKISECRSQNQLNGRVVDTSLRAVRQALSILYGQIEQDNGYSATGSETSHTLSRSLAKA